MMNCHSLSSIDALPPAVGRLQTLCDHDPQWAVRLARRLYRRMQNAPLPAETWARFLLGYALLRWERTAEAEQILQQVAADFAGLGCTKATLLTRYNLLQAQLLQGRGEQLLQEWKTLANDCDAANLPLEAAQVLMCQSWHCNLLGRPREALALAQIAQPLIDQQGSLADQGRLRRIMAASYSECGEADQALALIEEALIIFRQMAAPVELARCLVERSWHLQRKEIFDPALDDIKAAKDIFTTYALPFRTAICERHHGLLLSRLGRYDEALTATLQARQTFLELKHLDGAALCDMNLGIIAYYSGLFDLALAAYQRAEVVYSTLNYQRSILVTRRNQALVLQAMGQTTSALERLDALIPLAETIHEQSELAEIYHAQGQALRSLQQHRGALDRLLMAEALFARLNNHAAVAESRLEQGWVWLGRNDFTMAQTCFHACQADLAQRPSHLWRARYGLARCAEGQGQPEQALTYYQKACTTVSQLRGRLVSEHASSGIFAQAQQLYYDALRCALALGEPEVVLSLAEQQRAIALARQWQPSIADKRSLSYEDMASRNDLQRLPATHCTVEQLDALINTTVERWLKSRHQHSSVHDMPDITLDLELLRQLWTNAYPDGWVAINFIPCEDTLIVVMFDDAEIHILTRPLHLGLRRLIAQMSLPSYRKYTYLDHPYHQGQSDQPWSIFTELGHQLIPDVVQQRLHPTIRLLIVAGGELHNLSWAALRIRSSWLIEQAVIQLLPALHLWPTLASRLKSGTDALLIGISDVGERGKPLLNAIPSLDLAARHLPGNIERLGDGAATRQQIVDWSDCGRLQTFRLIHFACHGQLVASRGALAHIKLADDDIFYEDVLQLRLGSATVILAACEGAASEILPGDEILSLSRAFLAAGACDVIASQWKIYDGSLLKLLEPLYQKLEDGNDAPTALAYAQRQMIRNDVSLASPALWASLCVIGAGLTERQRSI